MFQTPVRSRTANAGQATWLKRLAAVRGTSVPRRRSTGTSAASVSCPPTHTVAARTCRNSLMVSQLTGSISALVRSRRAERVQCLAGSLVTVVRVQLLADAVGVQLAPHWGQHA